ncbi:hypothetical protein PF005_g11934 [Phytophthora fragariae]|uniref:Uncharacterized protein n=1 Tax=Phytophthora fragariae TaxID=53985 RepID=A0A6A3D661_9STRA|nr:hypothetical protein PF003_g6976 [Phytophthora fragariae]KAE8916485.1 hypothetical protein PF009_g33192 [Phytophthora fragariae]KAE8951917.1 hypothetical protein PF011_g32846 [Phytophthora fragariae]KAE9053204.1 hypothetical protein PF010_g33008 [Phytophthora fragariae]KAE9053761.1 hypothetical protein PF007_g32853 [Phytophthora fragariae]
MGRKFLLSLTVLKKTCALSYIHGACAVIHVCTWMLTASKHNACMFSVTVVILSTCINNDYGKKT